MAQVYKNPNLNVVIPMAGAGSRFSAAGYLLPKPLIDVNGKPMIQVVKECLNIEANYIFIVQKDHYERYGLGSVLESIAPGCKIVQVDGLTEGAACTVLTAKEHINNDKHMFIINSDQFVEWDAVDCMTSFKDDGGILVFESNNPNYSYARVDETGYVCEVAEKKLISNLATVGGYYWDKGSDFVKYAEQMIAANKRVNNEFYVAPVYQEAINDGKKISVKGIKRFWSLGIPEDLDYFIREYKYQ